jgi:hypothetical protein
LLNIIAGTLSSPTVPVVPNSYESIATATPTSGQSITFSSIPATYKHLQIRYIAQTDRATYPTSAMYLQFNGQGDGTTNMSYHTLSGSGSSASASGSANADRYYCSQISSNAATNVFGIGVIDILDYSDTNKYKTIRTLGGYDTNGNVNGLGQIALTSGNFRSTSALSSITIGFAFGSNYQSGTQFALYGIKGV